MLSAWINSGYIGNLFSIFTGYIKPEDGGEGEGVGICGHVTFPFLVKIRTVGPTKWRIRSNIPTLS